MIEYGTVSRESQFSAGKEVRTVLIFTQSVKVERDNEIIDMFKQMLEARSKGELHDPGISLKEQDGLVKRVVKRWSVYE
jgi:hypothetical protein